MNVMSCVRMHVFCIAYRPCRTEQISWSCYMMDNAFKYKLERLQESKESLPDKGNFQMSVKVMMIFWLNKTNRGFLSAIGLSDIV